MDKNELKEIRKQKLPSVTAFSPRDSLSELSSPLGLPKEFTQMEQQLKEMHYCCILYEMLPTILMSSHLREEKDSRKLAAISVLTSSLVRYFYLPYDGTHDFTGVSEDLTGDAG